mgnify:FL=1
MSITVTLTEQEILNKPNYYELGELVQEKYWNQRKSFENGRSDDENFIIHADENGLVTKIQHAWTCSICGESTQNVDYDYLIGYDHLACHLKQDRDVEFDHCVICGKRSPYTRNTHIDQRIGYVEGGGQGCFQPIQCDKV